ncbi:MAG: methyltransferase domain-containing protein [Sandaracinaceae bacterium]
MKKKGGTAARGLSTSAVAQAGVRWFRPLFPESMTGLDRSQGMLDVARERLEDAPGDAEIRLLQGDALEAPFEDGTFGLITCFGAGRVLPGGRAPLRARGSADARRESCFVFITSERPPAYSPSLWVARLQRGDAGAQR